MFSRYWIWVAFSRCLRPRGPVSVATAGRWSSNGLYQRVRMDLASLHCERLPPCPVAYRPLAFGKNIMKTKFKIPLQFLTQSEARQRNYSNAILLGNR